MDKLYLAIIAIFALLFGYAKLDLLLSRKREKKALTESKKAKAEASLSTSSANIYASLVSQLAKKPTESVEDENDKATPPTTQIHSETQETVLKHKLEQESVVGNNEKERILEQMKRIRQMRGL